MLVEGELKIWEGFARAHPASRAVVPRWEEVAGWTNRVVGLFSEAQLVGGLVFSVRRIPYLPHALSRINLLLLDSEALRFSAELLLGQVERCCVRERILETEIRIRMPYQDERDANVEIFEAFLAWGYRPLHKAESTYVIRIDRTDDDLLSSFDAHARRAIRRSLSRGVRVEPSDSMELLSRFYEDLTVNARRKGAPIPKRRLVEALRSEIKRGDVLLFLERYGDGVANMAIVDCLGVPCYVLGTRSLAHLRNEVSGFGQSLHFGIMRYFRERGKHLYDLGGCEGAIPIPGHSNFGVWNFKFGFRGRFVRFWPYMRRQRGVLSRAVLEFAHRVRGDYV